ncbi:MAG: nicotinamide mononucleotide transporter [Treponema sp.]|nr:nicotinamide mononucleotide transporter [Treponema sp.]
MKNKLLYFFKKFYVQLIMMVILVALTIVFKQSVIKIIPCIVSLFVYMLDSELNRFGKLLGAFNCFIYAIGYFIDGLYGSVISALAYSAPLQIVTFILWTKNKDGKGTKLHILNNFFRVLCIVASLVVAAVYILIFKNVESSSYTILQGLSTAIGLVSTILVIFGYVEGVYINCLSFIFILIQYCLYIFVDGEIAQITYIVINLYSFIYTIISCVNWTKIYKEQQRRLSLQTSSKE